MITKSGEEMAFVTIEDEYDSIEAVLFPRLWRSAREFVEKDKVVILKGNIEEQEDVRRILVSDCSELTTFGNS